MKTLTTIELCAGAGGQALGLERAGIEHVALVEWDRHACNTLRVNRPQWNVVQGGHPGIRRISLSWCRYRFWRAALPPIFCGGQAIG